MLTDHSNLILMKMENNQMMLNISEISDSGNEHSENR